MQVLSQYSHKEIPPRKARRLSILITAGPTREPIDPVRFISNNSTGRMGYALAKIAARKKHKVVLLSGPTHLRPPGGVKTIYVDTARCLYKKIHERLKKADLLIMTSAVSDFRPDHVRKGKIKTKNTISVKLVRNPDILKSISQKERKSKIIVGFSLETGNLIQHARKKMRMKGLDLMVANEINKENTPFGDGAKTVYLIDNLNRIKRLWKTPKDAIARVILDTAEELCYTPK